MRIGVLHIADISEQASRREGVSHPGAALRAVGAAVDLVARVSSGVRVSGDQDCDVTFTLRPRMRGQRAARLVLDGLYQLGLKGSVGVADDELTAWLAAQDLLPTLKRNHQTAMDFGDIHVVPVGGSPARVSRLPLEAISLPEGAGDALRALGVTTIGEFAQLPSPTTHTRAALEQAVSAAHTLARGESPAPHRLPPVGDISEFFGVAKGASAAELVSIVTHRCDVRAEARSLSPRHQTLTLFADDGTETWEDPSQVPVDKVYRAAQLTFEKVTLVDRRRQPQKPGRLTPKPTVTRAPRRQRSLF